MAVPYIFANTPGGASIPLSQLDDDFAYLAGNLSNFQMDALTITVANTFPPLSLTPNLNLFLLIINGSVFTPVGASPPFSVSGTTITWTSLLYAVNPGDSVVAVYSF